jgi:hypothetical protein
MHYLELAGVDPSFGVPEIMGLLHPKPYAWSIAQHKTEPHSHIDRHRMSLGQDAMQHLARDAEGGRKLGFRHVQRGHDILSQNRSRMRVGSVWTANYFSAGHCFTVQW